MYYIDKDKKLTAELIMKYVDDFRNNKLPRLQKLKRYYDCENDKIMERIFTDSSKSNIKIATPWAKYISDIVSAYFVGKPVTYTSKDAALLGELTDIFRYNDETTKNQQLAIDMSTYGIAYELLYLVGGEQIRFSMVNPQTIIPIYDNSINEDLLYCIRFYNTVEILTNVVSTSVEVYTEENVKYFTITKNARQEAEITEDRVEDHYFKEVPINIYKNNNDATGDFEKVISLIDGYDLSLSDTANTREELNNSYLLFRNTNLETDDIITMKEKRIIQIEDTQEGMQSSVAFLNKDSNDVESENYKTRLASDIHKFSYVNDLMDVKSHTSATSARLGMMGLEQLTAIKESYFKYALMRRIEIICNILDAKSRPYNFNDISMVFLRNIPMDFSVMADSLSKIAPFVSKETLLSRLDFISDVQEELARKAKEDSNNSYPPIEGDDIGL